MVCCGICYTAPIRHVLSSLACLGMTLAYTMRQVLPITIIEMTKSQYTVDTCPSRERTNETALDKNSTEKMDWTEVQQALVLMAFYFGYSISHFPAGPLINKFGARWPIFCGMSISTIANGIIPVAAQYHWSVVLCLRTLTGVGQSVMLPGISSLLTFWIPLESRSVTAAIIFAGVPMGTFLGIYMSAIVMIHYESWHYAYYMWSILSIPWLIFFVIYIYSFPESHPRLELEGSSYFHSDFIQKDVEDTTLPKFTACSTIFSTFGHTYILFTLTTYLPKYLNNVLLYNLEDNSVFSATPFGCMYLSGICSRGVFRWFVNKKNVDQELLRVIYCSICNVLSGAIMVGGLYIDCSYSHAILSLIHTAAFFIGFFYGGLNVLDMSMKYSGMVTSIINGCASTSGIAAIAVIAVVVKNNSMKEWQIVMWILLGVVIMTWCIDLCFTVAKKYLLSKYDAEHIKKWYQNMPAEEHEAKIANIQALRLELKRKQKGHASEETVGTTSA